ncbi:hypothetical protein SDC9_144809 [bioreactor metagenome]|uniref:Uncharacterized protein n=1 Tax=bioreactor metagenome TaxID=1076179 RepID=A0A645E716_9ZZZZ
MAHVPAQAAAVLAVGQQLLHGEKPALRQHGVDARARVPLAEHKAVAVLHLGVSRVVVQHIGIQHGDDIRHGKNAADVRGAAPVGHVQAMAADLVRQPDAFFSVHPWCSSIFWGLGAPAASGSQIFRRTHSKVFQNRAASVGKDWLWA